MILGITNILSKRVSSLVSVALVAISLVSTVAAPVIVNAKPTFTPKKYSITVTTDIRVAEKPDKNNKPVLGATKSNKSNVFDFNKSMKERVVYLPKGTLIYLYFADARYSMDISSKDVVATPTEMYHLPEHVSGALKVTGEGTATVTMTQTSPETLTNSSENSEIWSGYVRNGEPGSFTQVSSKWTVPAVTCSNGSTHAVAWVGIDGSTNHDLIQAGSRSSCGANNVPYYRLWWEILPAYATMLSCDVSAGNEVSVEIKQLVATTFRITVQNLTTGVDCSPPDQNYSGPLDSTEWILERPLIYDEQTETNIPSTLAKYGTMSFSNNLQNNVSPGHNYSTDKRIMTATESPSSTVLSSPSQPNTANNGFTVSYCNLPGGCPTPLLSSWTHLSPGGNQSHNEIRSIAVNSSDVWTAGWEQPTSGDKTGVLYRYNNGSWTKHIPPLAASGNHWLYGVASTSTGDTWAVGNYVTSKPQTLAYRWNGSNWLQVPSDNPAGASKVHYLSQVAIDANNTPWAVGYYNTSQTFKMPLLEKWNGFKFEHQPLPLPAGHTYADLQALGFSSATNGWAVGGGQGNIQGPVFYRYNGANWTASTGNLVNASLSSIAAVSDNEAWAVGSRPVNGNYLPLIMRYSNGSWSEVSGLASYPTETILNNISANDPSDIWIAGQYTSTAGKVIPLTMHYDGTAWSQVNMPPTPNLNTPLYAIAAGQGKVWTGGGANTTTAQNNVYPYLLVANQ